MKNEVDIRVPSAVPKETRDVPQPDERVCAHCGNPIDADNGVEIGGEWYCRECVGDTPRICPHCDEPICTDEDDDEFEGHPYHTECLDEFTESCSECECRFRTDEMEIVHAESGRLTRVCETCRDAYYFQCQDCEEWFPISHRNMFADMEICSDCACHWEECSNCGCAINTDSEDLEHDSDGNVICSSCYETDYIRCENCGDIVHRNDATRSDDGEWYCDPCYEDGCGHTRGLMDYHEFGKDSYSARLCDSEEFHRTRLLYGVELECDNGTFDFDAFSRWTDDDALIHFERDGSLSSRGVECITQPCSLLFHQTRMDWRGITEKLVRQGFVSHNCSTCGLHVHISRRTLRPTTIVKTDVFVNRAKAFFRQIARRDTFYGDDYDTLKRAKVDKAFVDRDRNNRYTAVNTTNRNSVEIRIFRGTLKPETILGTIELCDALVRFIENVPVARIYETDENVLKFVDYCGENAKTYPNLMPMLARLVKTGPAVSNIKAWYNKMTFNRNRIANGEE